jgi:hypothetical protein
MSVSSRPAKGAYRDRHDTRAGMRWTRAASAREASQGGSLRERVRRVHDRRSSRTAKACGPGARSLCVKSCGGAATRPGSLHQRSAGRRWQECIAHRGERAISRKPIAQGRPGCLGCPVVFPLCFIAHSCAQRAMGASRHPVFPAPSFRTEGEEIKQSSGKSRRENAKSCLLFEIQIGRPQPSRGAWG